MSKPVKTTKQPLTASKRRFAEQQVLRNIKAVLHKHRAVGEKRLRELAVIAARSLSPELGRAMEKVLIHEQSGAQVRKKKRNPRRSRS